MSITILTTLQSELQEIRTYISEKKSSVNILTQNLTILTIFREIESKVSVIIKRTYAAAGVVAIASSDEATIATQLNVENMYEKVNNITLDNLQDAQNFMSSVTSAVEPKIKSIDTDVLLYAAITKKSEYLDFYCNNKINVKLLFDSKKIKVGDSGPGITGKTSCLLTQYKMKGAEKSDDSAKINYDELITTLTKALKVEGLEKSDKAIVEEIITKANEVTQAKNAADYNKKIGNLKIEIAKIQSEFKTDPTAPADAPPSITINGTECKSDVDVKAAFNKIVGIDDAKLATNPPTPSKLEKLATEYYEFNIRESRKKDTSTQGIRISTQAKIQSAINSVKATTPTITAKEYDYKFKEDKVFVDMNKDDSGLVCDLPKQHNKYVFEFEFDLSEFVFDLQSGQVSPQPSPESPHKNILLLHKGSWISIVFKNVHIPLKQTFGTFMPSETDPYTEFDGNIKQGALMLMLSIDNTDYPKPKTAGVVEATQIDMSPFKDLFFMKTNPIIFGTLNDSKIEFQYVKLTGKKVESKKPGVLNILTQSVTQSVKDFSRSRKEATDLNTRKQLFMQKTRDTVNAFRQTCIKDGKVDAETSNQYIRNLYNSNIDEGQLQDIFGFTGQMPLLIFALTQYLIPNDTNVENSMLLIVRALAGHENLQSWSQRLNVSPIQNQALVRVQGGGAAITEDNINKAAGIIKGMMNTLTGKQFITPNVSSSFTNGLEAAEQKIKLNKTDPDAIEITVPPPSIISTSGSAQNASSPPSSPSDKITGVLSNLFGSNSRSSSASSSSDGTNMETCGNTANVTCSGENLIVTITLKTSDLLNQCGITHENIANQSQHVHAGATPDAPHDATPDAPPELDHAAAVINHIKVLSKEKASAYIKTLTPSQLSLIKDTHITQLSPDLKDAIDDAKAKALAMAKAKASGAGDGSDTRTVIENTGSASDKKSNNLNISLVPNHDLKVNKTLILTPSDGNGKEITYTSLNKNIATVDTAGIVTGVNAGKARINITQPENDKMKAANFNIEVTVVAEITTPIKELTTNNLSFTSAPADPITLDIMAGPKTNTYDLGTVNVPKSDVNKTTPFTYTSTNDKIATVDANSGLVKGEDVGECEINITQAATSVFAEGKLKVNVEVVDSSTKTPPEPSKSAGEIKYNELKAQYDAINKTREELKDKIAEIITKIKKITMSPEEIKNEKNERRYEDLKAQYEAVTKTTEALTKKSKEIIDEINILIPEEVN